MRQKSALLLAALLTAGAPDALAQTSSPPTLRWSDVAALIDNDPRIDEARFRSEEARSAFDLARRAPNPIVELQVGRTVSSEPARRPDLGLQLTVPLDWLNDRGLRLDAASSEARAAELDALATRLATTRHLRELFIRLAVEQARLRELKVLEADTEQLVRLVSLRVEKGESRPIEKPRAEVELEKVRLELATVAADEETYRKQLATWLAGLPDAGFRVEVDLAALPELPSLEDAIAEALGQHPELRAAQTRLEARQAEIGIERRKRLPRFALNAYAEQEPERRVFGGGIGIELPVWNWNSAGIRRAEAAKAAQAAQAEAGERELRARVIEAWGACKRSGLAAIRYGTEVMPRVEKASVTLERTYQLGEAGLLDVIDARRSLVAARREQLEAQLQAQLECARLQSLLGRETP
ncbi:MAG: TolC family protein [Myxococcales bacterium]|jgi:cobalt-zinc-cadmium efflux system outer membrane protein